MICAGEKARQAACAAAPAPAFPILKEDIKETFRIAAKANRVDFKINYKDLNQLQMFI